MNKSLTYIIFCNFRYVIDEYAIARRSVLVRLFIEALTEGGPSGKPIEMHAHDPKRYIGDMFAFLHQALPTEKENLNTLLKLCDKNGKRFCFLSRILFNFLYT